MIWRILIALFGLAVVSSLKAASITVTTSENPDGIRVTVTVEGRNGRTIALQESVDLENWTTIATHKFKANAPFVFTTVTRDPKRFYRAVEQ